LLAAPFEDQACFVRYKDPPQPHERVGQTFCGT
jgi:serine/tyrosine/threonine adenylyltransferase